MAGEPVSPLSIVVTGLGMVSSLGTNAISACAAARAGISRAAPLEGANVYDEESGELIPIAGHCATVTNGFSSLGRVARLGQKAIQDLMSSPGASRIDLGSLAVLCAVPGGYYWCERHRQELQPVADSLPFDSEAAINFENGERQEEFRVALVARLSTVSPIPLNGSLSRLYFGEQAAMAMALKDAVADLQSGRFSACLVGGIDSLVDPMTLSDLSSLGILKTPLEATGFMPGEAAGFALLETHEHASRRGAAIHAVIEEPIVQREDIHRFRDIPVGGRALAAAISEAAGPYCENGSSPGLLIGNLNGDTWRAREWGTALVRLPAYLRTIPLWTPVESFGEVGAASGAVALCVGVRAFQRGYARTRTIVVWLSGDDGAKGSFILRHLSN
jgi:Beta-ketoacyl synthase, N-terminal domain